MDERILECLELETKRQHEIKAILRNQICRKAIKNFKLKNLPLKWKMYYFFVKTRWTFGVYVVTKAILRLKDRR